MPTELDIPWHTKSASITGGSSATTASSPSLVPSSEGLSRLTGKSSG